MPSIQEIIIIRYCRLKRFVARSNVFRLLQVGVCINFINPQAGLILQLDSFNDRTIAKFSDNVCLIFTSDSSENIRRTHECQSLWKMRISWTNHHFTGVGSNCFYCIIYQNIAQFFQNHQEHQAGDGNNMLVKSNVATESLGKVVLWNAHVMIKCVLWLKSHTMNTFLSRIVSLLFLWRRASDPIGWELRKWNQSARDRVLSHSTR